MKNPREWLRTTACGPNPDDWYPEQPKAQRMARRAKAACLGTDGIHPVCPILNECREWAMETNQRWGIWGGLSERERNTLRKERKKEAERELAPVIQLSAAREAKVEKEKAARFAKAAAAKKTSSTTQRKADGQLGRWATAKKQGGFLLPDVKQYLLTRPQDEDRHHELIHVSELAKNDWCPRATYRRIAAVRAGNKVVRDAPHFQLDNIYEEGDRIHDKWQKWFWDMGQLFGLFKCEYCKTLWWDTAPEACQECDAPRRCLTYCEVAMDDPDSLIVAHADGEIRGKDVLIEVKSIGAGTVRVEAPATLAKHSHKYADENGVERTHLDHDALWRDLRRPFSSHLRQGLLYLWLREQYGERLGWPPVKKIVFIYEYKPTQAVKDFPVTLDREGRKVAEEIVDSCKDIVYALESGFTPMCAKGRRPDPKDPCKPCAEIDKLIGEGDAAEAEARGGDNSRKRAGNREGLSLASSTGGRTLIARRPDRPARQRPDGTARPDHSLGGLLAGAAGNGVGRRTRR